MSRPRVKLAHLVALVLVSGTAMGALRYPSPLVASASLTGLAALLLAATAAALRVREPARTFYLGFAIFGWGFGLLTFAPGAENGPASRLLSTHLINTYAPASAASHALQVAGMPYPLQNLRGTADGIRLYPLGDQTLAQAGTSASATLAFTLTSAGPDPNFVPIAQAVAVLALALAGGIFARLFLAPAPCESGPSKVEHGGQPA